MAQDLDMGLGDLDWDEESASTTGKRAMILASRVDGTECSSTGTDVESAFLGFRSGKKVG